VCLVLFSLVAAAFLANKDVYIVVDGVLPHTGASAAPAVISAGSGSQNSGTVDHDTLRGTGDQPDTADTGMANSSRVSGTSNPTSASHPVQTGVGENAGNSSRNSEAQGSLSNNESGADETAESQTPLLQRVRLDEAGANQPAASDPEG